MRALKAAVIAMGVLITGATAALIVLIALKVTSHPAANKPPAKAPAVQAANPALPPAVQAANPALPHAVLVATLGEPTGSRILSMVPVANGLALALSGGGEADRVVIVDPASGRVVERVELGH